MSRPQVTDVFNRDAGQFGIISLPSHQARAGGFIEGNAKLNARDSTNLSQMNPGVKP